MSKKILSIALILALTASMAAKADNSGYVEFSGVLREHSYDLDIVDGSNRFFIDELYRSGWKVEAGWMIAPGWTVVADYSKHDGDNADGIILTPLVRVQAPIFYAFQRASIGLKKNWSMGEDLWLDTTISYQRTEQGVGNFYIESGVLSFGLDRIEKDSGGAAELALRKNSGDWVFELIGGYDPHAGFELSASDIVVESSAYGGAGIAYNFGDHFKIGAEARFGKIDDLSLTLAVLF